jgi:hypothetical protein
MPSSGEIAISKKVLPSLPSGYEETRLGDPLGAKRQFRNSNGIHVREYEEKFVIHADRVDPRKNLVGHLALDSPETILALGLGFAAGSSKRNSERFEPTRRSMGFHPLIFFMAFLTLDGFFRRIKRRILA